MDKKLSKKSIDRLIYSLMAAMLALIVVVSVLTVSFRRGGRTDTTGGTQGASDSVRAADSASDSSVKPSDTSRIEPETTAAPTPDTTAKPASADTDDAPTSSEVRYFVMPVVGAVAKGFEIDVPVYSLTMNDYRAHTGIDVSSSLGGEVVAASSGVVCKIWNDPLMGRCVSIDHGDGIYTTYMNLAEDSGASLEVGGKVSMGQAIGAVGESAIVEIAEEPHLHLEMKVGGKYVDPLEYMGVYSEQDLEYEG